jgi:hypothetical protein
MKIEPGTNNETTHLHLTTKTHDIFIKVYDAEEEAVAAIYTNQPGCVPKKSLRGYQYIMVLTDINSNATLVEPMKNHTAGEIISTYQKLIERLQSAGVTPKQNILENKCSEKFKSTIRKSDMTFQLVPPHDHWRKIAKKVIQTFKVHVISILCGTDKDFLLYFWCHFLQQIDHTLNKIQSARVTPTVSTYTYLWRQHDYNSNTFFPTWLQS